MYHSLNIGCGDSIHGTNRVDITRDSKATELALGTQLPYKDESFNFISAENVLEHQSNPLEFLQECYRVLKKKGVMDIITDNAGYLGWFPILFKFQDIHGSYSNPKSPMDKHYMIFTLNHVITLAKAAGFRVPHSELFTRWNPTLIQKFWTLLSPSLGYSQIYLQVIK